jgi:hypothetical protein
MAGSIVKEQSDAHGHSEQSEESPLAAREMTASDCQGEKRLAMAIRIPS